MTTKIDPNRNAVLRAWAVAQIAPWLTHHVPVPEVRTTFGMLNATDRAVFVMTVEDGQVVLDDKPAYAPRHDEVASIEEASKRASLYRSWLETVAREMCPSLRTSLAIFVGDGALDDPPAPIFAFQKPLGNHSLLLPDVNLIGFPAAHDDQAYIDKSCTAGFVGVTSGGLITKEGLIRGGATPRIRSARFFQNHQPDVSFKLPVIVQCDSAETFELLHELGFGDGKIVPWSDQLRHKFILSMDGNGATCQRIVMTLSSNSVLVKYDSPHVLYYFGGLQPWLHYIPVESDQEVLKILEIERRLPGFFEPISQSGQKFAQTFLSRDAVLHYSSILLQLYADWLDGRQGKGEYKTTMSKYAAEQTAGKLATPDHAGPLYGEVLADLHDALNPKSYFEIGTLYGETLALAKCESLAVDPDFPIRCDVLNNKPACHFYRQTSDEFFAQHSPFRIINAPIDLAFLDGMHAFEFLLRDFMNTERYCDRNSVIVMHDCIPTDIHVARRDVMDQTHAALSAHSGWWAGDVWKTLLILRKFRPDLKVYCLDAPPTGLVVITDLDQHSSVLAQNYDAAVKEFEGLSLADYGVRNFHQDIGLRPTASIWDSGEGPERLITGRLACMSKKQVQQTAHEANAGRPLVTRAEGNDAMVTILAHLSQVGDVVGSSGFINLGSDTFTFEGFSLNCDDDAVEYRVRPYNGSWSDWTRKGTFAGTRGQAIPLTAFTIRLLESARNRYTLSAIGRFVGVADLVQVVDGEDCMSASGSALCGIQVALIRRLH